jgi:hypothetical protein
MSIFSGNKYTLCRADDRQCQHKKAAGSVEGELATGQPRQLGACADAARAPPAPSLPGERLVRLIGIGTARALTARALDALPIFFVGQLGRENHCAIEDEQGSPAEGTTALQLAAGRRLVVAQVIVPAHFEPEVPGVCIAQPVKIPAAHRSRCHGRERPRARRGDWRG